MTDQTHSIQCNCGAVTLELSGAPAAVVTCHCNSCRGSRDGVMFPLVAWSTDQTRVAAGEDQLVAHDYTPKMKTFSCGKCGTTMYNTNGLGLHVTSQNRFRRAAGGTLPKEFESQIHLFYADRVVDAGDDLPKFKDLPADFGGSGETIS